MRHSNADIIRRARFTSFNHCADAIISDFSSLVVAASLRVTWEMHLSSEKLSQEPGDETIKEWRSRTYVKIKSDHCLVTDGLPSDNNITPSSSGLVLNSDRNDIYSSIPILYIQGLYCQGEIRTVIITEHRNIKVIIDVYRELAS